MTGKPDRSACICGSPVCKQVSLCYQSLGDARGCMLTLPPVGGKRKAEIKEYKLERAVHHLGLGKNNYKQYATVDRRNRSTKPITPSPTKRTRSKTKSSEPKAIKEKKVIAAHHFHPEVVALFTNDEKCKYHDSISATFIKDQGLWKNGYTEMDEFKPGIKGVEEKVYVPVPSYKLDDAISDYNLVSTRHRLNDVIQSSSEAIRGHTFLSRRGEDNILQPVEKLPRLSATDTDVLTSAVCVMASNYEDLQRQNRLLKEQLEQDNTRQDHAAYERIVKGKGHGLTRMNISSDTYHKNNPRVARTHFRFEDTAKGSKLSSWQVTRQFIKNMWGLEPVEPTYSMIKDESGRTKKLTKFETCLVALMFFQNAYEHEFIGEIFGCHRDIVSKCIKAWAPQFGEVGAQMARHTLSKAFLDKSYPQSYKDLNFKPPVASIVDGTDVLMQSVRVDRAVHIMQASNKVSASAARGCTWSIPIGMVHEFSDPIFARPSEKAIVKLWTGHGRFKDLPVDYLISADKGFDGTCGFYPHFNPVIHPAFLTGGNGAQFTEEQIDWNRKACEMRYTSEVVFSRFKRYGGLGGIVRRQHFPYLRDMWAWAHGMANYYNCLQEPANNTYFPESRYSKKK